MNSQRNRKRSRNDRTSNTLSHEKSKEENNKGAIHTKGGEDVDNCISKKIKEKTSSRDNYAKNNHSIHDHSNNICKAYKCDAIDFNKTEKSIGTQDHVCECTEDNNSVNEKVVNQKRSKKYKRTRKDNTITNKYNKDNDNNSIDSDECSNDSHGSNNTDYDDCTCAFEHNFINDKVVILNVGGNIVKTLQSTLLSMPSSFSVWISDNFKSFPRDANNYPYLDRDVESFKLILNYLRGYGLPSKVSDLVLLAEDAMYYQLTSLQNEIGLDTPLIWRFNAGPGVNHDGNVFSMQDILGVCGSEPLSMHHTHTIVFKIDKCELVTLGVIALGDVKENMQLQRQHNSISYCSTGELVRYFAEEPLFTAGTSYKAQDLITITVKFEKSTNVSEYLDFQETTASTLVVPALESSESRNATLHGRNEQSSATSFDQSHQQHVLNESHVDQSTLLHSRVEELETQMNGATTESSSRLMDNTNNFNANNNNRGQVNAAEEQCLIRNEEEEQPMEPNTFNSSNWHAIITFKKEEKTEFSVRWPSPVPPIQFAVSMQGVSSVTIVNAISLDNECNDEVNVINNKSTQAVTDTMVVNPSSILINDDSLPIIQRFAFILQDRLERITDDIISNQKVNKYSSLCHL